MSEKNSFGFATLVYGQGMVVTHTFATITEAMAERGWFMRGMMVDAASPILRFSDGRWREMSHAEKIVAVHDQGETHMSDECGKCIAMREYMDEAHRRLEEGVTA